MKKTLKMVDVGNHTYQFLALPNTNIFQMEVVNTIGANIEHMMECEYPEEDSIYGISHLIEHLGFRRTRQYTSSDLMRQIGNMGAYNASTSYDYINYWLKGVTENVGLIIDLISDVAFNDLTRIPLDEFEMERKVVVNEIQRYADDPQAMFMMNAEKSIFETADHGGLSHAYNIIGCAEEVMDITFEEVVKIKNMMLAGGKHIINITYDPALLNSKYIIEAIERKIKENLLPKFDASIGQKIHKNMPVIALADRDIFLGGYGEQSNTSLSIQSEPDKDMIINTAVRYLSSYSQSSLDTVIREDNGLTYGLWFYNHNQFNTPLISFQCDVTPGDEEKLIQLFKQSIIQNCKELTVDMMDEFLKSNKIKRTLANMDLNIYSQYLTTAYTGVNTYIDTAAFEEDIDAAIAAIYNNVHTFDNIKAEIDTIELKVSNDDWHIVRNWTTP